MPVVVYNTAEHVDRSVICKASSLDPTIGVGPRPRPALLPYAGGSSGVGSEEAGGFRPSKH